MGQNPRGEKFPCWLHYMATYKFVSFIHQHTSKFSELNECATIAKHSSNSALDNVSVYKLDNSRHKVKV